MKTVRIFTVTFVLVVLICGSSWAKRTEPEPICPAGFAGLWVGSAGDISWFATQTSDSTDSSKGEMLMNWTFIKPGFIGGVYSGVTLTPGHGVWQENDNGDYDYNWYAYAIDPSSGAIVYTIRTSGVASFQDPTDPSAQINCSMLYIYYDIRMAEGDALLSADLDPSNFPDPSKFPEGSGVTTPGWKAGELRVTMVPTQAQ